MKIILDANVIISAILFPQSIISNMVKHIITNHELFICQYTIDEINEVFNKKFNGRIREMKLFLEKLPYELFANKRINSKSYPKIRDINDLPVLANAIDSKVELLITGDKDFDEVKAKGLKIIKPKEYVEKYMV